MTDDLAARRTVQTVLQTWFSFSGRLSPREYLKRYLILLCVSFAMASATFFFLKAGALDNSIVLTSFGFFIFVTTVIFSVSLVSLIARRLHDFDCRALWATCYSFCFGRLQQSCHRLAQQLPFWRCLQ